MVPSVELVNGAARAVPRTSAGRVRRTRGVYCWNVSRGVSVTRAPRASRAVIALVGSILFHACNRSTPAPLPTMPSPPSTTAACGVERWSVKTLADADALRVDPLNATPTTITALNALTARCAGLPDGRTFAEEFQVYEVLGTVLLTRSEDDRDVHIALADPNDGTKTIVVEVADPACVTASPFLTTLSNARRQYQSLGSLAGRQVRVRGVGFYDFAHGQTGRSASCLELHPVLNITAP